MQVGPWRFHPSWAGTLATLVATPLLMSLGFWQIDRAHQKEALHDTFVSRSTAAPVDLAGMGAQRDDPDYMLYRHVRVTGDFAPPAYLLDNQVHDGEVGYDVYGLLDMPGGESVMVNRGWIPMKGGRDAAPGIPPAAGGPLVGIAKPPGASGIMLEDTPPEQLRPGLYRVERIDVSRIARDQHRKLLPFEIRLEPPAPPGLVREWSIPGSGQERHLGYAFQWFAMAATVVIIYLVVNLDRKAPA